MPPKRKSAAATESKPMQPPPPPRALLNEDILHELFQCFRLRPEMLYRRSNQEERATLFHAACVCKRFADSALPSLWRELDSIVPLLRILSSSCIRMEVEDQNTGDDYYQTKLVYIFHAPVAADEWLRFLHYARFVRKMRFNSEVCHPSVLSELNYLARATNLFPSVTSFSTPTPSGVDLLPFMSPNLREVTIGPLRGSSLATPMSPKDCSCARFLSMLALEVPSLPKLVISGQSHPSSVEYLLHFKQLRYLRISFTAWSALSIIARLENLAELALKLDGDDDSDSDSPIPRGFQVLEDLKVIMSRKYLPLGFQSFLSAISSRKLRTFSVSMMSTRGHWWPSLGGCISSLGTCCASSIRVFAFKADRSYPDDKVLNIREHLIPLFKLSQLQTLKLDYSSHCGNIALAREDIAYAAQAWPQMEEFTLLCPEKTSMPSLDCLVQFALHTPKLRWLSISQLTTTGLSKVESYPFLRHGMKILGPMTTKHRVDSVVVARFLDHIFPELDNNASYAHTKDPKWHEVFTTLGALQAARREPRQVMQEGPV